MGITITGWVVSFWTVIFISILFYCAIEAISYAVFQMSLRITDVRYTPFHPDQSGGLSYLMRPSVIFMRAMGVLLVTFFLFVVYDFYINNIIESKRIWGFVVYVVIVVPVFFLPLSHFHKIMKYERLHIVYQLFSKDGGKEIDFLEGAWQYRYSANDLLNALEILEKQKKLQQHLPIWPMPIGSLLEQASPLLMAIVPIAQKVIVSTIH